MQARFQYAFKSIAYTYKEEIPISFYQQTFIFQIINSPRKYPTSPKPFRTIQFFYLNNTERYVPVPARMCHQAWSWKIGANTPRYSLLINLQINHQSSAFRNQAWDGNTDTWWQLIHIVKSWYLWWIEIMIFVVNLMSWIL